MDSLGKKKSSFDDLKTRQTQLLADLVSTLDEKQYKIFEKYLTNVFVCDIIYTTEVSNYGG